MSRAAVKPQTPEIPPSSALDLAAEDYRGAIDLLTHLLQDLQERHQALLREAMPRLRQATIRARACKEALAGQVEAAPRLFENPKTRVLHGIKLGWRKAPDAWSYPPDAALVAAIKEHLPELAAALIEVKETPHKPSIKMLSEEALADLAVSCTPGQDQLVLDPVDSEVDKLIKALLGDAAKELHLG